MFHLIRCENPETKEGKVYLLRNTENFRQDKKPRYLSGDDMIEVPEGEKNANIIIDITERLTDMLGKNVLEKTHITNVFSSRKNTPIFAILKRGENGRDIIVRAFSITRGEEVHEP
jgi:hypothetical protein